MAPSLILVLLFSLRVFALTPDPSGQSKIGNGQHLSNIGSQCLSSLDCGANGNTACCAFLPQTGGQTIGICSACGATTEQGKQGCGFGDDQGRNLVGDPQICPAGSFVPEGSVSGTGMMGPRTLKRLAKYEQRRAVQLQLQQQQQKHQQPRSVPPLRRQEGAVQLPDPALDAGAGNGKNAQFITGRCVNSRDCGASQTDLKNVCCASMMDIATGQTVGVCSGSAVGNTAPKLGCGFGDGLPNSAVSSLPSSPFSPGNITTPPPFITQPPPVTLPDPNLDAGKGNQQNQQFITGACINSKDCGAQQDDLANVCCAGVLTGGQLVGVCSGSAVAHESPKTGCGFGDEKANSAE